MGPQARVRMSLHRKKKYRQCTNKRKVERSRNHSCRGKAIGVTYSEGLSVPLVIQHAKRMRRIILSSVACLALPFFPHIIS
jgi:hypothetical protein